MSIAVSDVLVRETWVIGKENPGDKDDYVYRQFHYRYCTPYCANSTNNGIFASPVGVALLNVILDAKRRQKCAVAAFRVSI